MELGVCIRALSSAGDGDQASLPACWVSGSAGEVFMSCHTSGKPFQSEREVWGYHYILVIGIMANKIAIFLLHHVSPQHRQQPSLLSKDD